jgi:hypothetical protein
MQSASLPVRYLQNGLECANGDQIPADVIVFATGFIGNLRLVVSNIFGPEVAGQLDDYWGIDDEGELKGAFKYSGRTYTNFLVRSILGSLRRIHFRSRFLVCWWSNWPSSIHVTVDCAPD